MRVAAVLLLSSLIVLLIARVFHPTGAGPNDHVATFTHYARAGDTSDSATGLAALVEF